MLQRFTTLALSCVAAFRSRLTWPVAGLFALHGIALAILLRTEGRFVPIIVAILAWGFFNAAWLVLLRRPLVAAGLTLAHLVVLILLSQFKHDILLMTVNFVDLMLIDADTLTFLLNIFPRLDVKAGLAALFAIGALAGLWWLDPWRLARRSAAKSATLCFAAMIGLAVAVPSDPWEEFYAENYFSKFVRSGVTVIGDLMTRGILDADAKAVDRLTAPASACTVEKPPHILFIHDESSFDARVIPGIKTPEDYGQHFVSGDGQRRVLLVEGPGGPSWYTEFNMLTGLSGRSFGRFIDFATRIAAGRIERGLPRTLANCGYKTFTLYPMYGSFLSAKRFQTTAGIQHFLDSRDLGASFLDPDAFYFNKAADEIAKHKASGQPLFMLVYTAQNHFPWSFRYRPDLAKDWRDLGNRADVDEYLRRQHLTATDYQAFLARLKRDFPQERFLIVRFGDHQPYFARSLIDPAQNDSMMVRRVAAADKRFLATYYTIEGINFAPRTVNSALTELDAPYLPLVVLEAAGVPLDPSFAEQKKILQRCQGLFYRCNGGTEARRFNRLLIDAGLIKGL
jgi:phosphoglycerol transferase MdoB-like AlkP superfamily enzyme